MFLGDVVSLKGDVAFLGAVTQYVPSPRLWERDRVRGHDSLLKGIQLRQFVAHETPKNRGNEKN